MQNFNLTKSLKNAPCEGVFPFVGLPPCDLLSKYYSVSVGRLMTPELQNLEVVVSNISTHVPHVSRK